MFSVIISEKGGAERREAFDRTEINVGRVQGNDLMLPKGNVSKRHARLLFRDGRFIVTDLKSTNGTYVNGRKIVQATIVREGDKIYIGDFILRIETGAAVQSSGASAVVDAQLEVPSEPTSGETSAPLRLVAVAPPRPASAEDPVGFPLRDGGEAASFVVPAPPRIPIVPPRADPRPVPAPGPPSSPADRRPPLPTSPEGRPSVPILSVTAKSAGIGGSLPPVVPMPPGRTLPAGTGSVPMPTMASVGSSSSLAPSSATLAPPTPPVATPTAMPPRKAAVAEPTQRTREPALAAAHRAALATLVQYVGDEFDVAALETGEPVDEATSQRVARVVGERLAAMRVAGEVPADVDGEALAVEAARELCDLGPLGPLLADEDVSEVQVIRHDFVVAMRARRHVVGEVAFTSEAALVRALRRLCWSAGAPLGQAERYVERRMRDGGRLFAVMPAAPDQGHALVLRKPQRADLTLEDLVRSGTISRGMAGLLAQCVIARANILVTGSVGAGTTSLLGALAGAGGTDDRVLVLQEADEIIFSQPHTVSLLLGGVPVEDALAVRAATRLHPDRLVIGAFAGHVAAEVVDAIGDGVDGVLAAARSPNLRQAVARLPADLAATRPGVTPEVAREWLASAFDLAIEIARLRDGRHRVLRIAELAVEGNAIALRDVFTFAVERTAAGGALEGTFQPTGHVPRVVEDLAARGVAVDSAVFKRHVLR